MKYTFRLLFILFSLSVVSCSSSRDDEKIQQDINDMFKKDLAGAALNATVDSGMVTITGQCAGNGCTTDVTERVKKVKGVKDVQTNIIEK